MIILRDKLFSRPKGKEETDRQKKNRKASTRIIVGTGAGTGAMFGNVSGDLKSINIQGKGAIISQRIVKEAKRDIEAGRKWASNAIKYAKNPKEVIDYATKKVEERGAKAEKDIDRITKVANRSARKASLKSIGKGAVIGTAIAAPLAYAANKKIKSSNEKINAKRRGIKD